MKPLKKSKGWGKGHTSMSRPHPNRKNKLRPDKKANRQEAVKNANKEILETHKELFKRLRENGD